MTRAEKDFLDRLAADPLNPELTRQFGVEVVREVPEAPAKEPKQGISLWRLYSRSKSAYVVGAFPRQDGVKHEAFHMACAAWPGWEDRGSGSCEAGPGAFRPDLRESEVLLLPGTAAPDVLRERDELRDEVELKSLALRGQVEMAAKIADERDRMRAWAERLKNALRTEELQRDELADALVSLVTNEHGAQVRELPAKVEAILRALGKLA